MSDLIGGIVSIAFFLLGLAAWITHVLVTINQAAWVLLVIGSLFFPIGVVHGIGIWLGLV